MSNWFRDLLNSKKKYDMYDREGCAATGKITCEKGKVNCKDCDYAKLFLKTGKKVDVDAIKYILSDKKIMNNFLKNNNININNNIHLSKYEKDKIRQEHLRLYNTPKPPYIYKGNEIVNTDFATYVDIKWNDGTTTTAVCSSEDTFNYGYGVLIATAKKFVKKLDFDFIEIICRNNRAIIISILELLLLNIQGAGSKCVNDIRKEAKRTLKKTITLDDLISKILYENKNK